MTISNFGFNPYPTSNPLTSRHIGNNNVMWNQTGFRRCSQSTPVPNSKPFSMEDFQKSQSLEVPCQNQIPMGCEGRMPMVPEYNSDIFQCPDGTLISKSTGRILRDNTKSTDFPGQKMRMINTGSISKEWNDKEIMDFDMSHQKEREAGLSKADIEYAKISEIENKKLEDNMTGLQKKLLADLESGKIVKKSKLVPESMGNPR
jgi:hypothetical protein